MSYCTVAQVTGEFKSITISETSPVSTADVTRFIEEAGQEIDSTIGTRYEAPVDTSDCPLSAVLLRSIAIGLVSHRVREILGLKNSGDQQPASYQKSSADVARKQLEKISQGLLLLPDATQLSSGQGVNSFNVSNEEEHTFEKGVDQW